MIIDVHTHTFPDKIANKTIDKLSHDAMIRPFTGGMLSELADSVKAAGIDLALVLPIATSPSQVVKINDSSARINEKYQGKTVFSLGCIHPDYEDYKTELRRIRSLGLKGIKLHPFYQDTCLDDIRYLRILDEAASLGLAAVTHSGLDVGFPGLVRCSPQMCRRVIDEIGPFSFILAHMGGWENWEEALSLYAGTGVYFDTAFSYIPKYPLGPSGESGSRAEEGAAPMMEQDLFLQFVDAFGADHILFGTDSPWSPQDVFLKRIQELPLDEKQKTLILGENARRLFGF